MEPIQKSPITPQPEAQRRAPQQQMPPRQTMNPIMDPVEPTLTPAQQMVRLLHRNNKLLELIASQNQKIVQMEQNKQGSRRIGTGLTIVKWLIIVGGILMILLAAKNFFTDLLSFNLPSTESIALPNGTKEAFGQGANDIKALINAFSK